MVNSSDFIELQEEQVTVLCEVICKATGDRASKINYTRQVYMDLIDERENQIRKDLIDDLISQVESKGFYDEIIQEDLVNFLNKFKEELEK